ncbi:MAG: hypothetical protein DWQ40_09325 [Actinobacteria bacterium]|nr:MAG: hypothetical protein DWQ40_09325 [Actinomycetota bacterium]REK39783.1 MAG: hypothetical protein DWQ20_02825 [Actinomycetota bacterium]
MSDDARIDRSGIHIEKDLADAVAIEEELDSNVVGPYRFPSPQRRRTAGWVYVAAALIVAITVDGGWVPAIGLLALAAWHFASAWPLEVDENSALRVAGQAVEFPVGHASGAVTFKGWRSRPRWAVILYSGTEPPDRRALVVVDAVNGGVAEDVYVEDIPAV